jgi:hypothetical protein
LFATSDLRGEAMNDEKFSSRIPKPRSATQQHKGEMKTEFA